MVDIEVVIPHSIKKDCATLSLDSRDIVGIDITVVRVVALTCMEKKHTVEEHVTRVGSFGTMRTEHPQHCMATDSTGPWFQIYDDEKEPTGFCKQEFSIKSTMSLDCPSTTVIRGRLTVQVSDERRVRP